MAEAKQTEIPQEMRVFVSQNIDQAHDACKQLMDAAYESAGHDEINGPGKSGDSGINRGCRAGNEVHAAKSRCWVLAGA